MARLEPELTDTRGMSTTWLAEEVLLCPGGRSVLGRRQVVECDHKVLSVLGELIRGGRLPLVVEACERAARDMEGRRKRRRAAEEAKYSGAAEPRTLTAAGMVRK